MKIITIILTIIYFLISVLMLILNKGRWKKDKTTTLIFLITAILSAYVSINLIIN